MCCAWSREKWRNRLLDVKADRAFDHTIHTPEKGILPAVLQLADHAFDRTTHTPEKSMFAGVLQLALPNAGRLAYRP